MNKHPQRDIRKAPGRPKKKHLNPKQELFVKSFVLSGDKTAANRIAGYSEKTEVARSEKIQQEIETNRKKMEELFQTAAQDMFNNMLKLATSSSSDNVKFQASKDLLDRAGFKPVERKELSGLDGNAISLESRVTHDLIQRTLALGTSGDD